MQKKIKNEIASLLGQMARGIPKKYSKAELKRRSELMKKLNLKRKKK